MTVVASNPLPTTAWTSPNTFPYISVSSVWVHMHACMCVLPEDGAVARVMGHSGYCPCSFVLASITDLRAENHSGLTDEKLMEYSCFETRFRLLDFSHIGF